MVIDTSALVAILFEESEAVEMQLAIESASVRALSAVTRVELSFVIESRKGDNGRRDLEKLLSRAQIEIAGVTPAQADLAIGAFQRFGKGRHRAGLNLGDCFSYALAKTLDEPLLFKGDDFAKTDVRPALITSTR